MSGVELRVGFIPLVDAAPVILAHELGFAQEVGLSLLPVSAPSWSALRDRLAFGEVAAAHMLSAVPVASALGLGGLPVRLDALSILSVNGTSSVCRSRWRPGCATRALALTLPMRWRRAGR